LFENGPTKPSRPLPEQIILTQSLKPAQNTSVHFYSIYDTTRTPAYSFMTDARGKFSFKTLPQNTLFNMQVSDDSSILFQDSVFWNEDTIAIAADTLEPKHSIVIGVQIQPHHNAKAVFLSGIGNPVYATADSSGFIAITGIAASPYTFRLHSAQPGYTHAFISLSPSQIVYQDTLRDTIALPYIGTPVVQGVFAQYDSITQSVTVSWNQTSALQFHSYAVFRRDTSIWGSSPAFIGQTTDTLFTDSTLYRVAGEEKIAHSDSVSYTYEYSVKIRTTQNTLGAAYSPAVITTVAPSSFNLGGSIELLKKSPESTFTDTLKARLTASIENRDLTALIARCIWENGDTTLLVNQHLDSLTPRQTIADTIAFIEQKNQSCRLELLVFSGENFSASFVQTYEPVAAELLVDTSHPLAAFDTHAFKLSPIATDQAQPLQFTAADSDLVILGDSLYFSPTIQDTGKRSFRFYATDGYLTSVTTHPPVSVILPPLYEFDITPLTYFGLATAVYQDNIIIANLSETPAIHSVSSIDGTVGYVTAPPHQFSGSSAFISGEKLYLSMGYTETNSTFSDYKGIDHFLRYDFSSFTWDTLPAPLSPRYDGFAASGPGDTVYFHSGFHPKGSHNYSIERYSISENSSEIIDSLASFCPFAEIQYHKNKLYVLQQPCFSNTKKLIAYDLQTGEATELAPPPFTLWRSRTAIVNDQLYTFGGRDNDADTVSRAIYQYDIPSDTWTRKMDLSYKRFFHDVIALEDKVYIIGGIDFPLTNGAGGSANTVIEVYVPALDTAVQ